MSLDQLTGTAIVLATLDTKRDETEFFLSALRARGVAADLVDASLGSNGAVWDGSTKLSAIESVGTDLAALLMKSLDPSVRVVVGLGGGTGAEIVLRAMRALPATFPKVLITTLPFDPRVAVADNSIVLVPTVVDLAGLNDTVRYILRSAAAMVAGLCAMDDAPSSDGTPSIGITSLGVTGPAVDAVVSGLRVWGEESTVFHANGLGGAALVRFAEAGALKAVADLTCHELTRILFAGLCAPMPARFSAMADIPRVVVPGAMNFIGLGELHTVPETYLERPHYQHTGYFTHVKLTDEEMRIASATLADHLNAAAAAVKVVVPMGGFSHQDCPGGEIEDAGLRQVCLDVLTERARHYTVSDIPSHINAPETARAVLEALRPHLQE